MQQHQSNVWTISFETSANYNESVCSINYFCSTHSNLHENDDDECYGKSAENKTHLTHNNTHENDDDECYSW